MKIVRRWLALLLCCLLMTSGMAENAVETGEEQPPVVVGAESSPVYTSEEDKEAPLEQPYDAPVGDVALPADQPEGEALSPSIEPTNDTAVPEDEPDTETEQAESVEAVEHTETEPFYVQLTGDSTALAAGDGNSFALKKDAVALCIEEDEDDSKIAFYFGERIIVATIQTNVLKKLDEKKDAHLWDANQLKDYTLYNNNPDYPLPQADLTQKESAAEDPVQVPADYPDETAIPDETGVPDEAGIPGEKGIARVSDKVVAQTEATYAVDGINIPTSLSLGLKEQFALPGIDETMSCTTSSKSIATVSAAGVIKGVKAGKATITVTTAEGNKATCAVTVKTAPTKVTVSPTKWTLGVGMEGTLKANLPSKTASQITWVTSNSAVATVENGTFTAVGEGTAKITAKTFNGKSATCTVTVKPAPTDVVLEDIKISTEQTIKIAGKLLPDNAMGTITYVSSDESVLNVDGNMLTGVSAGTAVVTATTNNGGTAECTVTVAEGPTQVTLDRTSVSVGLKESLPLIVSIDADEELFQYNTWKTSNKKIVTVSAAGVIKGVKKGKATITVTAANGKKATCKVTVLKAPSKVTVSPTKMTLGAGMEGKLKATLPSKTASQISWTTSNSAVATVENGVVTAVAEGTAKITAKTFNGKKSTCTVTVKPAPTDVILPAEMKICPEQTIAISGKLLPDNAIGTITYASADESIVSVDGDKLTGVSMGTTVITATTNNGCTTTCMVTVVEGPTQVVLDHTSASLGVKETMALKVSIDGDEDLLAYTTWQSSNKKIVTVSATGVIKGVKVGKATITATAANGKKATCKVTVLKAPTKVTVSPAKLALGVGLEGILKATLPSKTASQITWTTSNSAVATVENGMVTAVGEGTAKIMAKTFNGKKATCTVTVKSKPEGDYTYTLAPEGATITGYTGTAKKVSVPGMISGAKVIAIGPSAFAENTTLTSVTLPSSIATIDELAFGGCTALTTCAIPSNTKTLGDGAFLNCVSLNSVKIPASIRYIGSYAFAACAKITGVTVPDTVEEIGDHVFDTCVSLTSVKLPTWLEIIPEGFFANCTALKKYSIPDGILFVMPEAFLNCTGITSVTMTDSVLGLGYSAFSGCTALTNVHFSSNLIVLGDGCFEDCTKLASVQLPETTLSVGERCFRSCTALKEIDLPDGIEEIPKETFWTCSALTRIKLPAACKCIGDHAFYDCKQLGGIDFPDQLSYIGEQAFFSCQSIPSLSFPDSLEEVGRMAFYCCHGVRLIHFGTGIKTIRNNAFSGSGTIPLIYLPDGLETLEDGAFSYTKMTEVSLPGTLLSWGKNAFYHCSSLTTVELRDGLTEIGAFAFYDCTRLENISFGKSLKKIGTSTFFGCTSLSKVTLPDGLEEIGARAFSYCTGLASIDLPEGVTAIGEAAFLASGLSEPLVLPEGLTSLGQKAFSYCTRLESVILPASLGTIQQEVFAGCTALRDVDIRGPVIFIPFGAFSDTAIETIVLPDTIRSIEYEAFSNSALSSITLPSGMTVISGGAFRGCHNLTEYTIPPQVTEIRDFAFAESGLTHIEVPSTVRTMRNGAFFGCQNLREAVLPTELECLESNVFSGCSSLVSVTLPENLTEIPDGTFNGCVSLSGVHIPNGVKKIGYTAFGSCKAMTSLSLPEGVEYIRMCAFIESGIRELALPASVSTIEVSGLKNIPVLEALTFYCDEVDLANSQLSPCSEALVIHCHEGSTAQAYAQAKGIAFAFLSD